MNRNILVGKVIDKKGELPIYVMLPDYYNPEIGPEASTWDRNKKKSFGISLMCLENGRRSVKQLIGKKGM